MGDGRVRRPCRRRSGRHWKTKAESQAFTLSNVPTAAVRPGEVQATLRVTGSIAALNSVYLLRRASWEAGPASTAAAMPALRAVAAWISISYCCLSRNPEPAWQPAI